VLEDPPPRPTREIPELEVVGPWAAEARPPEVVGASSAPTPIGSRVTAASVVLSPPTGPAREMADEAGPKVGTRVHLRLENVTATRLGAEVVDVYVNVPDPSRARDFPDQRAGSMPMFGVLQASQRDARHSGSGVSATFDITAIVQRLRTRGQWNPEQLRVVFAPVPDANGHVPEGDVAVGRVSLLYS
jgi:tyrosinase